MPAKRRGTDTVREDGGLRLPRPPGVFRRFWARHPVLADVLLALLCIVLTITPAARIDDADRGPVGLVLAALLPLCVVVASATLLWRRRKPWLPAIAAILLDVFLLFTALPGSSPLLLFAGYSLAVYRSTRAAWTAFGIGVAASASGAGLLLWAGIFTLQEAVNALLGTVVLGLIGTLIGANVGSRKRYLDAVIDRSRQLLVERDQQAQLAAAAERARIAREMHDIVSHSLTVVVALSEGAAATPDREQARAAATSAADTARSALTQMRAMLGVLRDDDAPLLLAPVSPASPQETVAAAQRTGYPVTLATAGQAEVSSDVAHALGRIVQEGLTNAMRHAPTASTVSVRLEYAPGTVVIEIVNDGVAGTPGEGGFGLRGLLERAAHVRGTLESRPDGAGRWLLRAVLPTSSEAPAVSPRGEGNT
ncbi:sensor histidine kinase [Microbacterium sp. LCT-H2]|uniref:sensor histidine kinase n=1 Tax=Microbacterium sp. LCT-H2 TaxID=1914306 RepID=UPI000AA5DE69|nr:sensor histidine kinase [Microbacterium sp. LCT-H2]